jgi:hypothetical protein
MKSITGRAAGAVVLMAVSMFALSCTNEFNNDAAPVLVVVTNTQEIDTIDLLSGAAGCDGNIGTILIQTILKDPNIVVDQRFNDVRFTRYRVSYRRTDGGTLIPQPFTLAMDLLVTANSQAPLGGFRIFNVEQITQAPFAALLPNNGGRDPETNRRTVSMEVTLEIFGETLAGTNVSGSTTFPITFCFDCGGCS